MPNNKTFDSTFSFRFMLYHLMQASNGKDITLHVSANNPAMVSTSEFDVLKEEERVVDTIACGKIGSRRA